AGTVDFDPGADTVLLYGEAIQTMFLAKYDAAGNYVWAHNAEGQGHLSAGYALSVDLTGNIYVTGIIGFTPADFDPGPDTVMLNPEGFMNILVAQYGSCGRYRAAINLKGDPSSFGYGWNIAFHPSGDAYVCGRFSGTVDFDPGVGMEQFTAGKDN